MAKYPCLMCGKAVPKRRREMPGDNGIKECCSKKCSERCYAEGAADEAAENASMNRAYAQAEMDASAQAEMLHGFE